MEIPFRERMLRIDIGKIDVLLEVHKQLRYNAFSLDEGFVDSELVFERIDRLAQDVSEATYVQNYCK